MTEIDMKDPRVLGGVLDVGLAMTVYLFARAVPAEEEALFWEAAMDRLVNQGFSGKEAGEIIEAMRIATQKVRFNCLPFSRKEDG